MLILFLNEGKKELFILENESIIVKFSVNISNLWFVNWCSIRKWTFLTRSLTRYRCRWWTMIFWVANSRNRNWRKLLLCLILSLFIVVTVSRVDVSWRGEHCFLFNSYLYASDIRFAKQYIRASCAWFGSCSIIYVML